ncbi:polymorphic toxin-type HINT domain-containing protein [Streptomyces sp. NBC_00347]|uniref:polymorphic toxin-type HINT domain-containing protein n=1 Tax=Streptomyces sp. NBC_00347 TaxID=2975721 RepID=UPI002257B11A|nr:polymorphic toxin-type HINT domain-containing protein [Streptomyces sp. NBC_00347]MCX5129467.1 polymorphic toxin-type HINT domain-containing protein [Streptomyces sp. NBC_00347]
MPRPVQKNESVPGKDAKRSPVKAPAKTPKWKPSPVSWPAAGSADVALPATLPSAKANPAPLVKAGSLPVRVAQPATAAQAAGAASGDSGKSAPAGPSRVRVTVADHKATQQAGINGLLLSVTRTDGSAAAGTAQVEVDYAKIRDAFGAAWGSSLRLSLVPGCALTTPSKAECLQRTPLPSRNDTKSSTLSASVDLPATAAPSSLLKSAPSTLAAPAGGTTVLLADAAPDSSEGSFKATSLASSGSWAAGGNSGSFTWNIPIGVPPVPGGLAPKVGLNYNSSSVDGRTGSSNNQSSWIGEGWEYNPGFIERTYASCENDKQGGNNSSIKSGDLCWKSENATLSLNGSSSELLWDAVKQVWKLSNDDGSRVERKYDPAGNGSGDEDSEYWKVTTGDGTQYWFGKNRLPGWTTGDEVTNSVNWVPVFGNHALEQGHETDFAASSENQGWRWNLDYVVDPHDNAMALYYTKYGAYYAKNGKIDDPVTYTRDSTLKKISYGLRAGEVYAPALAPAQVNFTVDNRCEAATCTFDEDHALDWPDVPVYLNCKIDTQCLQGAPSFWSTKRLKSIDTVALSGSAHVPVDTWALNQSYDPTADETKPALWLKSVTRTGKTGAPGDSPPLTTTFTGSLLPNRVDSADGLPPIFKQRLTDVVNETGGKTHVTYTDKDCTPTSLPTADNNNTRRCYPSWWTRDGGQDPVKSYFHKYLVLTVEESDSTPSAAFPTMTTKYINVGSPSWARDESEFTLDKQRTWNDFRGYRTVRTLTGNAPNRLRTENDYYLGTGTTINGVVDRRDFAGKVSESRVLDGEAGPVVEKTTHTPWESPENATQAVKAITDPDKPTTPGLTLAAKDARYSGTKTTVASKLMTDGTWQASTTTRHYDDTYGLLQTEGNDGAGTTEATCKVTQYTTPDTKNWLIAYPKQVTSTTAKPCSEDISPAAVTGATRTSYDGQAPGVAPKAGLALPTKAEQASKLDANSQLLWETTGQATHDQYGRALTTTGQDGEVTKTAYTPATGAQPTKITVTNPKGHVASSTSDGLRGLVLTATDANGRTVTSQYDSLGRLVKGWAAGRPTTEQPNVTYTYKLSAAAESTVTEKKLNENGSWSTSVALYDAMMRPRQTQTAAIGAPGRVVTDTFYDAYGRVRLTNAPYHQDEKTVSTALNQTAAPDIPSATETLYDDRGRATASVLLSKNVEKWRTTTTYGPDWQAVVPPQGGTATLAVSDARGRVIERRDYKDRTPGIGDAATLYEKHTYTYNRAGLLSKITDNSGRNTWTYGYDLRGRRTQSTDPDKGKSTTAYGADGRAESVTDARGITLASTYDELGRPTSLRKDTVTGTKLAAWAYDSATGGKGLAASTTRYDGTAAYTSTVIGYDDGGRPTGTKVTVPTVTGEEELAGTYTVTSTTSPVNGLPLTTAYSTSNSKATTALPAETVSNNYNARDQLRYVSSDLSQTYLQGILYTAFGEPEAMTFGNLSKIVGTNLDYDPATRRVQESLASRDLAGPSVLSQINYTYDPAGNITRITDKQDDATVIDNQCFTYDWARRMTEAWTSGDNCATKPVNGAGTPNLGTVDPYWTSWTFTDTGQRATEKQHKAGPITADTLRTHTYPTGTTAGHELQKVTTTGGSTGTDSYTYDQSGNLTTKDTAATAAQTLTWNEEGKLDTSTVSGKTTSFLYDTAGTRILKREPTTTTLYLPGGQELILTKATNAVTGNRYYTLPGGSAIRSSTDGRVRFLIADHHGTNTLSISATTQAYDRRKSLPYGAQRGAAPGYWPGQKGFVGGDTDTTTGFTHIGAREYDPTTGQFISVDPLLSLDLPQSLNGYNYANNSPITSYDPTGMREMCGASGNSCHPDEFNNDGSENFDNNRSTGIGTNQHGNDPDNRKGTSSSSAGAVSESVRQRESAHTALARAHMNNATYATWLSAYQKNLYGSVSLENQRGLEQYTEGDVDAAAANACFGPSAVYCPKAMLDYLETTEWQHVLESGAISEIGGGLGGIKGVGSGKGSPGCKCFLAGTEVLMSDGTTKSIEKIKLGDKVRATDPETGETGDREVTRLIITEDDKHFNTLSIATKNGIEELTATHEHPFWSPSANAWVEARELTPGSTLLTDRGATVIVTANRPHSQHARTYNLTVDDLHTYYVLAGNTPVLVHNSGGCGEDVYSIEDHVTPRHTRDGADADATKSLFDDGADLGELATGSAGQIGRYQSDTGNIRYFITGKDIVGTDRRGLPTKTYTIVRDGRDGELITMHPGLPRDLDP